MEQYVRRMWENIFTINKAWTWSVLSDAEKERQEGSQGDWQQEMPYKEQLELVGHRSDLSFGGSLVRRAYNAGKLGDWESYLKELRKDGKLSVCGQA